MTNSNCNCEGPCDCEPQNNRALPVGSREGSGSLIDQYLMMDGVPFGTVTVDRTIPPDPTKLRFYTQEQLGTSQSLTPEGFLLCTDVPVARVGKQLYAGYELPSLKARDGLIEISRDADEVFRPEAILSFAGKPVTNNHPPVKVTPDNYRMYSVGTVMNPRRGDGHNGTDPAFLYADLLITDAQAIADVRMGKREVSAGYDAEYEQTTDGAGRQHNILGNHVALVKRGRCGPLCSIGDEAMPTPRPRFKTSWANRIMKAVSTGDNDELVEELQKVDELMGEPVSGRPVVNSGDSGLNIHLHGVGSGGGPTISGGTSDQPDPSASADPSAPPAAGGDIASQLNALADRLGRIEQAIVLLAQGDDGDDSNNGNGDDPNGSDSWNHDEEATTPPTEDPQLKPGNVMPYGAETSANFEEPALTSKDKKADTKDHRIAQRRQLPSKQGTKQRFVGDSSSIQAEWNNTLQRAEIIMPGFRMPTFDSAKPASYTQDMLCQVRRGVLSAAMNDMNRRDYVAPMLADADVSQMTCDAVSVAFNGAAEFARKSANGVFATSGTAPRPPGSTAYRSPAEINRMWREHATRQSQ